MPMRHALVTHAANITGQLRQVTLGSVGYAGIRFTRMPAFFLSAELNPDDDDNRDDCNPNTHRPSPPCCPVRVYLPEGGNTLYRVGYDQ